MCDVYYIPDTILNTLFTNVFPTMTLWNGYYYSCLYRWEHGVTERLDDLPHCHTTEPEFKPRQSKPEFMFLTAKIYFVGDWYFLTPFGRRYQISPSSYSFILQQNSSMCQMLFFPHGMLFCPPFSSSFTHTLGSGVRASSGCESQFNMPLFL